MKRKLFLCCIGLFSVSILLAQSVHFETNLPDIVICYNKDAYGNDDTLGYYFENAFDFNNYVEVEGIEKSELYWGFEAKSLDAGSATPQLLVNGIGDTTGVFNENLTGVGTSEVNTLATFSVSETPTTGGTETYDFMVATGLDNQADKETCEVLVTYVDDGTSDFAVPGPPPGTNPVYLEKWEDADGWSAVDVYYNFGSYGNGSFSGEHSKVPTVADNMLSVELDNGEYMSYVSDYPCDVTAGKSYLIGVPIRVNYTQSGTGAASYPVIRLMAIYDNDGVKNSDYLMYLGATPAQNEFKTYCFSYTAESDSEDFKLRLDVLNGTGNTLSVDYDKLWLFPITDYATQPLGYWADTSGWYAVDVYASFGAYGRGVFSGPSQIPVVDNHKLHIGLNNSEYMAFLHENPYDVLEAGHYILKIPVQVDYTASGEGAGAYPVVRFVAYSDRAGAKAPDYLMYEGYAAASNRMVDYYVAFTAENEFEDFKYRLDVANGTGAPLGVHFGQIEVAKIDPDDISNISDYGFFNK